ncbi:hypothetical protein BJY04DRAFT_179090 [Aspergillus karnatakaensis]|uniref:uncharacterized protein n=1 Tax=Aspergillus karnatakaensis TaxID=1810916 RepID=UPI003CCE2A4B
MSMRAQLPQMMSEMPQGVRMYGLSESLFRNRSKKVSPLKPGKSTQSVQHEGP